MVIEKLRGIKRQKTSSHGNIAVRYRRAGMRHCDDAAVSCSRIFHVDERRPNKRVCGAYLRRQTIGRGSQEGSSPARSPVAVM